jgi:hypothetical protein
MKQKTWSQMVLALSIVGLLISACTIQVDRNPDGSLSLAVEVPESTIQEEIAAALNDPLIQSLEVDLHQGYFSVQADRKRAIGGEMDVLTFRVTLGENDGHLSAVVSEAKLNGEPINDEIVAVWNVRIANNLEQAGKRRPDCTLQSVSVTEDSLSLLWRVETARSRGQ